MRNGGGSRTRAYLDRCVARVMWMVPLFLILVADRASAQQASLGGTILSDGTEKPLANAEILIESVNKSVRSDSAGNFIITGLAAGKHTVLVRLVGYESLKADITLGATQKLEVDLLIKPNVTTLDRVDVTAEKGAGNWAIKLTEFEERRKLGIGKFVGAEDFEKGDGRPVSSLLLQRVSGLQAIQSNGRRWLATSGRSPKMFGAAAGAVTGTMEKIPPACYMQVVVNGRVEYNGTPGQAMYDIDALNSKDIIGVEIYSTATTPSQYNATRGQNMSSCGTVVIWTKGG